ncbi:MAG: cell wall hydrolase [Erysipelotrichaceae bacterium]|nr:cell wall hydrolase [Erysipelotrichaceae bacterium]
MRKFISYVLVFLLIGIIAWMFAATVQAAYEDDLYILSHVITGEAEGCSRDMKLSVGSVVLNRVSDDRFPDTIAEVVFQPGQYACTWDGNYYREPSQDTIEIAAELLEDGTAIDESVVWQAEFPQGVGVYDIIGNMYFCY